MQVHDASLAGAAYMLYYLDIQQLALQQAGGQTGPAARAAAVELMSKLPHSVVAARCGGTSMQGSAVHLVNALPGGIAVWLCTPDTHIQYSSSTPSTV